MNRRSNTAGAIACLLLTIPASIASAAEFTIIPLRVALDRAARAAEVTVRNDDRAPLRMQVQAMSWRQDAEGKDQYEPVDDLIYFPRALEIPPGDSRLIRVGIRAAPVSREETYRLFVEQLPPPDAGTAPAGASVRVLLRVGVPVFVAPAVVDRRGEITQLEIVAGRVHWTVANPGNVHFAADRVEVRAVGRDGTTLLTRHLQERYFLAGVLKPLQSELPREVCAQAATIEVSVTGDHVDLKRKLNVEPSACN
jgi:fimbrial chaperone protein